MNLDLPELPDGYKWCYFEGAWGMTRVQLRKRYRFWKLTYWHKVDECIPTSESGTVEDDIELGARVLADRQDLSAYRAVEWKKLQ